jgi:two-component system chemotaxis response regulator CheY
MKKKIMSVGQCNPDHNSIRLFLEKNFECEILRIDSTDEAIAELRKEPVDLVLVNRKLDIDYTDGTILIKKMKQDESLSHIPVMLVSNYPEYQEEAVALGAVYGIGKNELGTPQAITRVQEALKAKA